MMRCKVNTTPNVTGNDRWKQGVWRTYDAIEGLYSGVWCILQDRRGYLWLGTASGLHRYDGAEFVSYTTEDGLIHNVIYAAYEDTKGRLWLGTPNGLSCLQEEQFTNYSLGGEADGSSVVSICEDDSGILWFGTGDNGLFSFDGVDFRRYNTTKQSLDKNIIRALHKDSKGLLWFGNGRDGVSCFDGKSFKDYDVEDGLVGQHVKAIIHDHLGRLWIGTESGVSCFDGESFTNYRTENGLLSNCVQGICEDLQGKLWFATTGGVSCFDGNRFINYTTQQGLLDNRVISVIQDREGILWFAHPFSGLISFDQHSFLHLSDESVAEIVKKDEQGRLWFINENRLCCLHEGEQRCKDFEGSVHSALEDSRGTFWVSVSERGLYRYDSADDVWNDTPEVFTAEDGLESNIVLSLLETRDGTIWAGTARPGCMCRFNGEGFEPISAPHGAVLRMIEDRRGRIWIGGGTKGGGISCYDWECFMTYTLQDGLPSNLVHSIAEDDTGRIWIGTQRGLCSFDGKQFTLYGKEDGLLDPNHQTAAKEASGRLWFGTQKGGIYRSDGEHFQMLSTHDGLPSNGISSLLDQPDGSMLIGTYRGIVHYRSEARTDPLIEIREVIADHVYARPKDMELTTTEADLVTISYHGMSFATGQMRYSYIMEGYDTEWKDTWDKQVRYENLPEGEYTFKVIAINRDLSHSETPAALKLKITPDEWSQLRAEYEAEIEWMQKLLEFNHYVNSQDTLSDTAFAIVESLLNFGFDRAGVWIRDIGDEYLQCLWTTNIEGEICRASEEIYPVDLIPPDNGYHLSVDRHPADLPAGIDATDIQLEKDRHEDLFESIWGYPPPCPGYYQRDDHGDTIRLCVSAKGKKIGIISVDNNITRRSIDQTSANIISLVGTEMANVLANVALRESLAESEARNEAVLDAIPDLMFLIDREGNFLDYRNTHNNESYLPSADIIGKNMKDILPPDLNDILAIYVDQAFDSGDMQIAEFDLPLKENIQHYEARLVANANNEILAIVRNITERKQAEEMIKASLKEKEVLLKEIHHRVKNNLQIISSLLSLQSGYIKDESALQMFKESQNRVRSMALIHEKLYQSADLARIDFAEYIRDLANYLFRMYGANVRLDINVDSVSLDIDKAIPCGLIINELVSNSLKHGFPVSRFDGDPNDRHMNEVRIDLHLDDADKLVLVVGDNGVGFPEDIDFRNTKSLGLQLVNTLADQLEGDIEIDIRSGTTFRISFDYKNNAP